MPDSALLKIDRANEHIGEVSRALKERPPFSYVLETDTNLNERSLFVKRDEAAVERISLICADAIHNIRAALDHAYWEIVSPCVADEREQRAIQFPFNDRAENLLGTVKQRHAFRVSQAFGEFIVSLGAHPEAGGDSLLYMINELNVIDKHRLLVPTKDHKRFSMALIRRQVPDFPTNISLEGAILSGNRRDIGWNFQPGEFTAPGLPGIPRSSKFEQQIEMPINIVFATRTAHNSEPIVAALAAMADKGRNIIDLIRRSVR